MQFCIWSGTISVGEKIVGSIELSGVERGMNPIRTMSRSIVIKDPNGLDVLSCPECVQKGITTNVAYDNFKVELNPYRKYIVLYDVTILCNGTKDHRPREGCQASVVIKNAT